MFSQSHYLTMWRFLLSIFGRKINTCVPGAKPINGMYPACKFALTAISECLQQEVLYQELSTKVTVGKFCLLEFKFDKLLTRLR